jgi:hypothetical protein
MSKKILLVEGMADKSFYEMFCEKHALHLDVRIAKPCDLGGVRNTKQGAINHLPILLKSLADGQLDRLALIVDADQVEHGGGFQRTVEQIVKIVQPHGFSPEYVVLAGGGLLFRHADGLADFGLWVMPDNAAEGILEDWILQSVHANEQKLFGDAQVAVAALAPPKFRPIRRVKADVATWLAWQEKPGESLYYAVEATLLDEAAPLYLGLQSWLLTVFV